MKLCDLEAGMRVSTPRGPATVAFVLPSNDRIFVDLDCGEQVSYPAEILGRLGDPFVLTAEEKDMLGAAVDKILAEAREPLLAMFLKIHEAGMDVCRIAVKAERDACVRLCEEMDGAHRPIDCAAAIRLRDEIV